MSLLDTTHRETVPHKYPLEGDARAECKTILQRCKVFPCLSGYGFVITADEDDAYRLMAGWEVARDDVNLPITIKCSRFISPAATAPGEFVYIRGGERHFDLNMPPAIVDVAREILDEKR